MLFTTSWVAKGPAHEKTECARITGAKRTRRTMHPCALRLHHAPSRLTVWQRVRNFMAHAPSAETSHTPPGPLACVARLELSLRCVYGARCREAALITPRRNCATEHLAQPRDDRGAWIKRSSSSKRHAERTASSRTYASAASHAADSASAIDARINAQDYYKRPLLLKLMASATRR